MSKAKVKTTKYDIIQKASELFFEKGYSATSPKMLLIRKPLLVASSSITLNIVLYDVVVLVKQQILQIKY